MSSEVITNVATLQEYFVASIKKTSEIRSIFLRLLPEQFDYLNLVFRNALELIGHVPSYDAVFQGNALVNQLKIFLKLLV